MAPTYFWNFFISLVTTRLFNQTGRVCDIMQKYSDEGNKTLNIPISLLLIRVLGFSTKREKWGILHLQKPPIKRN